MATWREGQRIKGKGTYKRKKGTVVNHDGWVTRPSKAKANPGGLIVQVRWDDEPNEEPPDIVEDYQIKKI